MKNYFWYIIIMLIVSSCKKEKLPTPVQPTYCWQKFVGNYTVYDVSSGSSYSMTIQHFKDTNTSGYYVDYLRFLNFDVDIDFSTQFTCYSPSNYIDLGYNTNLATHSGTHYNLWDEGEDTSTPQAENYLKNDTIFFYFRRENTAYWVSDGVPYSDVYKHQIAVKQH